MVGTSRLVSLGVLLSCSFALADVLPIETKDGLVYPETCPESRRAGLECILATKGDLEIDEATKKRLSELGMKKVCEESHNDRYSGHWCRRPDPKRPIPTEVEKAVRGGYADEHAARMEFGLIEGRCLRWLRDNPGKAPSTSLACEQVSIRGVRELDAGPCEHGRCGAVVVPPREFVDAWDAGGDAGAADAGVDADAAASAPPARPPSRGCGRCSAAPGPATQSTEVVLVLATACLARARRRRARRSA